MKFPRYFSLLLALAMLLCAVPLAGLAEEERPTLTILMAQDTYVEDYETNAFTKFIEDSMNVNLDFELLPAADAADKLLGHDFLRPGASGRRQLQPGHHHDLSLCADRRVHPAQRLL